jgi:hypothetical protein
MRTGPLAALAQVVRLLHGPCAQKSTAAQWVPLPVLPNGHAPHTNVAAVAAGVQVTPG